MSIETVEYKRLEHRANHQPDASRGSVGSPIASTEDRNRTRLAMTGQTIPRAATSLDGEQQLEESIASVREALTGLRYGNVSLTVHEGRVVQIDVTEKRRLKPN